MSDISIMKKIIWRLWGGHAKQLLRAIIHLCTHWDYLSRRCFGWVARVYFCGMSHMDPLYDWFNIMKPIDEEAGLVAAGQFRFVYTPQIISALSTECNEILAEYILSRRLDDYYAILDSEGPYEIEEVALHEGDVVIDAGANLGVFSVLAAAKKAKKVYAFEPLELVCEILRQNISINGYLDKIIIEPLGLSNQTSMVPLYSDNGIDTASLVFRRDSNISMISCTTLDDWVEEHDIQQIDFIKADIEGAERELLKGAQETLRRFKPRLAICTYHLPDDPQVLKELIKQAVPEYKIIQKRKKLFAWV